MKTHGKLLLPILLLLFLFSCKKDDNGDKDPWWGLKTRILEVMQTDYLWNHTVPDVDIARYAHPMELMEALRYKPLDRWSYVQDMESYQQLFEDGVYLGYGFGLKWDARGQLRLSFVYDDSPAGRAGLNRSDRILSINNKRVEDLAASGTINQELGPAEPGHTISMQVLFSGDGDPSDISLSKDLVQMNTVLHHEVIMQNGIPVAYLVFNSFLQPSMDELKDAFSHFVEEGARELVLDLRYNGGGRLDVTQALCNHINAKDTREQVFLEFQYNNDRQGENQSYGFPDAILTMDVDRLFVIATQHTASASEVVINSMKPFIDVIIVGDNTYGKPVGSSPVSYQGEYAISAITFRIANAEGFGDYFDGFPPDGPADDGLDHVFGHPQEASLFEALHYIAHGYFSGGITKTEQIRSRSVELQGWQREIGAF